MKFLFPDMKSFKLHSTFVLFLFAIFIAGCKKKELVKPIKFYKVGERYNIGGEEGIVYKVVTLSGSMYAMAVSLDEAELIWSSESIKTDAVDLENGFKNQQAIQSIANWESKYPAFKWCSDKNKNGSGGWYFPSPAEMRELFSTRIEDEGSNISLSEYLKKKGGIGFSESDDKGQSPYWSSRESSSIDGSSANSATYVLDGGWSYQKNTPHKVRAIKYIQIYK